MSERKRKRKEDKLKERTNWCLGSHANRHKEIIEKDEKKPNDPNLTHSEIIIKMIAYQFFFWQTFVPQ